LPPHPRTMVIYVKLASLRHMQDIIYWEVVPNCYSSASKKAVLSSASRSSATVKKEFSPLFSSARDCSNMAVSSCRNSSATTFSRVRSHPFSHGRRLSYNFVLIVYGATMRATTRPGQKLMNYMYFRLKIAPF
jgi:hypothetical protein